jgi:hypothetical protein
MTYIGRSYDILVRMKIPNIDRYFKENFWFTIESEDAEKLLPLIKKFWCRTIFICHRLPA